MIIQSCTNGFEGKEMFTEHENRHPLGDPAGLETRIR